MPFAKTIRALAAVATLLLGAASAQAALVDRGGGMIYDTELNITWLQDWNYARTSGYAAANGGGSGSNVVNSDGTMGWDAANTWANNLVYGGFDDWRLPTMVDTGAAGCDRSYAGGTDCGYNVQTQSGSTVHSEMAHLYYVTLGNLAYCTPGDATCNTEQAGWGLKNTGPFSNMRVSNYWSGLEYAQIPSLAWRFTAGNGYQDLSFKMVAYYAVAVRLGDVAAAVPEPQTLALTLLALGAMAVARRRQVREAAAHHAEETAA